MVVVTCSLYEAWLCTYGRRNVECKECLLSVSPLFLLYLIYDEWKYENTLPLHASSSLDLFLLFEIVYLSNSNSEAATTASTSSSSRSAAASCSSRSAAACISSSSSRPPAGAGAAADQQQQNTATVAANSSNSSDYGYLKTCFSVFPWSMTASSLSVSLFQSNLLIS